MITMKKRGTGMSYGTYGDGSLRYSALGFGPPHSYNPWQNPNVIFGRYQALTIAFLCRKAIPLLGYYLVDSLGMLVEQFRICTLAPIFR
jgi:hypothetical protein